MIRKIDATTLLVPDDGRQMFSVTVTYHDGTMLNSTFVADENREWPDNTLEVIARAFARASK